MVIGWIEIPRGFGLREVYGKHVIRGEERVPNLAFLGGILKLIQIWSSARSKLGSSAIDYQLSYRPSRKGMNFFIPSARMEYSTSLHVGVAPKL